MSQNEPLMGQQTQSKGYLKKFGAPLAVAGASVAVALLLAGRSQTEQAKQDPIQELFTTTPASFLEQPTDLFMEGCDVNFNRMVAQHDGESFYNSSTFNDNMVDGKWEDPSFPADTSSLYWTHSQTKPSQTQAYQQVASRLKWKRPSELQGLSADLPEEIKEQSPSLFGVDGVQVRTSEQGDLGDCWFLSSATAVAETPSRIRSIFNNSEYSSNGAFQVNMFVHGSEKIQVTVDDRIPVRWYGPGYEEQFLYLNNGVSPQGAWWLVILEKAMAKLNVNYANLNEGYPGEALRALTGMPTSFYSGHRKESMSNDEVFDLLHDSEMKNYPMVAGTGSSTFDNLVAGHAYTILGTQIIYDNEGNVVERLVRMRNPWGKFMYTGPWSGHSDDWTPAYKAQVHDFSDDNEGIFFMPLAIWRKEYQAFTICHYNDDWKTHKITGDHSIYTSNNQAQEWLSFHNPVQQDVIIQCEQFTERLWPSDQCKAQKYFPKSYNTYLYNDDQYPQQITTHPGYAACVAGYGGQVLMLKDLAAGDYNLAVWDFGNESDVGHGIWSLKSWASEQQVEIQERASPYG